MEEIFYLDLRKNNLYGWEYLKDIFTVKSIIKGIKEGDDFPAVPVHKTIDNKFFLSKNVFLGNGFIDGGHHRAIAHYKTKKPLKCKLIVGEPTLEEKKDYILIKHIELEDYKEEYYIHKKLFSNYR